MLQLFCNQLVSNLFYKKLFQSNSSGTVFAVWVVWLKFLNLKKVHFCFYRTPLPLCLVREFVLISKVCPHLFLTSLLIILVCLCRKSFWISYDMSFLCWCNQSYPNPNQNNLTDFHYRQHVIKLANYFHFHKSYSSFLYLPDIFGICQW